MSLSMIDAIRVLLHIKVTASANFKQVRVSLLGRAMEL